VKIIESNNLKYDKTSKIFQDTEEYEKEDFEPRVCVLESFVRENGILKLYFKNKTHAVIEAKNIDGTKEVDLIAEKLNDFIGKSYKEILETDF